MRLNKGHAKRIFDWCKENYGRSKYAKYPYFSIKKFTDYDEDGLDGYYEPITNFVYVNSDILNSHDERYLASTIIEEYIHYTQSDSEYQRLAKIYDHDEHPYEIYAKRRSNTDSKKCIKYLKLMFNSFNL
jgi:hypothetical protein